MKQILSILGMVALLGCAGGQLSPQAQRAADTFACYVAVLTPYVGDAVSVVDLVSDAIQGRADLQRALQLLGSTPEDLEAVELAMTSCRAPELFVREFPE